LIAGHYLVCFGMELVVRNLKLHEEQVAPLISDRDEAMETFWAILERGDDFYPKLNEAEQRRPRVYRVVPLKGS